MVVGRLLVVGWDLASGFDLRKYVARMNGAKIPMKMTRYAAWNSTICVEKVLLHWYSEFNAVFTCSSSLWNTGTRYLAWYGTVVPGLVLKKYTGILPVYQY